MERARQGHRLHKLAKTAGTREGCCRCHRRQRIVPVVLNGFAAAATSRICREETLSGLIYRKEQRIHRWSLSSDRRGVVRAAVCTLFVIGDKKGGWFTIETKKGKRKGGFGLLLWAGDRMFVVTERRSQCRWSPVVTPVQGRHSLRRNPRVSVLKEEEDKGRLGLELGQFQVGLDLTRSRRILWPAPSSGTGQVSLNLISAQKPSRKRSVDISRRCHVDIIHTCQQLGQSTDEIWPNERTRSFFFFEVFGVTRSHNCDPLATTRFTQWIEWIGKLMIRG